MEVLGRVWQSSSLLTDTLSGHGRVFLVVYVCFVSRSPSPFRRAAFSPPVIDSGGELNVDSIIERLLEVRCCHMRFLVNLVARGSCFVWAQRGVSDLFS